MMQKSKYIGQIIGGLMLHHTSEIDYNLEELAEFTLMNYYSNNPASSSINSQIKSLDTIYIGKSKAYEYAPDEEINELVDIFINNPELEKEAAVIYCMDYIKRNIQP